MLSPRLLALSLVAVVLQGNGSDDLQVLRHLPETDASPTALILVTFDRPVAEREAHDLRGHHAAPRASRPAMSVRARSTSSRVIRRRYQSEAIPSVTGSVPSAAAAVKSGAGWPIV